MDIHGIHHLNGPQSVQGPGQLRATDGPELPESLQGADQLELSSAADSIQQTNGMDAVQSARVAQIRAEIAAGTYETPEKLELAVGRLFDELSG